MLKARFFIHPIDFMGMQRVELDEYPAVNEIQLNAMDYVKKYKNQQQGIPGTECYLKENSIT